MTQTISAVHTADQAKEMAELTWGGAIVEVYDITIDGQPGYDVVIWADEPAAENDDGANAIARYSVIRDDRASFRAFRKALIADETD